MRNKGYRLKSKIWIILLVSGFVIYSIIFFMTPNPYSAIHSGRTAYDSIYKSSSWAINTAYSMLLIVAMVTATFVLTSSKFKIYRFELFYITVLMLITVISGSLFNSTKSALYNICSVFCVLRLANMQATEKNSNNESLQSILKVWKIVNILLVFGIILAIIQPNRYGIINLDFSRSTRGEITYWLLLGLHIWGIVLSLAVYKYYSKKACWITIGIIIFTQVAFANRMGLLIVCIPVLFYLFFMTRTDKKIIVLLALAVIVYSQWEMIFNMFTAGNDISNIVGILNGRDKLWKFYIENLKEHPFLGAGLNLSSSSSYTGSAYSEIGVLKIFGEYGIIMGGLQLFAIISGVIKSIRILMKVDKTSTNINAVDLVMSLMVIANFLSFLIESYARILSFTDFFAWFSLYYVLFRKIAIPSKMSQNEPSRISKEDSV